MRQRAKCTVFLTRKVCLFDNRYNKKKRTVEFRK